MEDTQAWLKRLTILWLVGVLARVGSNPSPPLSKKPKIKFLGFFLFHILYIRHSYLFFPFIGV